MTPEEKARLSIDSMLKTAGGSVQNRAELGVAVRGIPILEELNERLAA